MAINFNNVPTTARASQNFIELAGVKRSLADLFIPPIGGLIGQYDASKTSTVDYLPVKVVSADDVGNKFGFGSQIHRMALAMSRVNPGVFLQGGGIYAFPIPEESGGTAASDTVTFTGGPATSAGTFYFSIGGDTIQVAVSVGDTVTNVGDAYDTAVAAKQNLPITSSNAAGVVTNTAKGKGTYGNFIKVVINPAGDSQEAKNPAGITVATGNSDGFLSSGATDPSVEDVFLNASGEDVLGDRWYTCFNVPLTDETNIGFHTTSADLRADPGVNRICVHVAGYQKASYSEALAFPAIVNSEYFWPIWDGDLYSPEWELSAAAMAHYLDNQNQSPNRPIKTLDTGLTVDPDKINMNYTAKDALFDDGMSYCYIDNSGVLRLGDQALSRRTNASGGEDTSWYDVQQISVRQAKAYSLEQLFLSDTYERGVVVDDSAVTNVNYAIAPKDIIAALTKLILDLWEPYAWSKNIDTIIAGITAEINSSYSSRIDAELTDDEARALRIIAVRYAFLY